jgi:drug/metabolite transporter (DMT)-like permease
METIFAYIFYFVAASASPLQRRHLAKTRETDVGQIDFAFKIMLITAVLSIVLVFFKRPVVHQSLTEIIFLAIGGGIFGSVSLATNYMAQRHVEAGVSTLVSNIYTPITIVLATVFLDEKLRPIQIVGTILLLISVVIVSKKHKISKWKFDKYFILMVVSGIALGIVLTTERALIKGNNITTGTWISWGSQAAFLLIPALIVRQVSQHNLKDTAVTSVLRFLQQLSWVVLVTIVANLSVASSITTFKVVIIFIAGAILLNEREDLKRKIIGSLIAVAGLLLMA